MKLLIYALFFLVNANDSLKNIEDMCLRQNKGNKQIKSAVDHCACVKRSLGKRLDKDFLQLLEKQYAEKNIDKELNEMEGASVIYDFNQDVITECKKNKDWVVADEDKGEQTATATPSSEKKTTKK